MKQARCQAGRWRCGCSRGRHRPARPGLDFRRERHLGGRGPADLPGGRRGEPRRAWVVYAKRPFGDVAQVFAYLGRYTHRVAINNARLVAVDADTVRFRTRDGRHATLTPDQFIGRFLLHVLPRRRLMKMKT